MNASIFNQALLYFDSKMKQTASCKILFIMYNCSTRGAKETLPMLSLVEILIHLPNTINLLQPLDTGIIAAMKVKYRERQTKQAFDLMKSGESNFHKVDFLAAMRYISKV